MKQCLIVDDSDVLRKVARHFIEQLDYKVMDAAAADEALAMCRQKMPDVILLDWILTGTTVQEFLTTLNAIPTAKRPLVIYCTTENDSADITRAFSAGADAYVMKPFDRESLVSKFVQLGLAA